VKPDELIAALNLHGVKYVIVGGFAAVLQGAHYITQDIDFCYARDPENLGRLVKALKPFAPVIRPNPQLGFDMNILQENANFTLDTAVGEIDLLGYIDGLGDFLEVEKAAEVFQVHGQDYLVLSLEGLIQSKEALNRRKDIQLLEELNAIHALRKKAVS